MILHPTIWKFSDVSVDSLVSYVVSSPALISLSSLCRRHDIDALRCLQSSRLSPVTLVNLLRLSPWPWCSFWRWYQTDHSKNTPEKQMTGEIRDSACCSLDLFISPEAVGIYQLEPGTLHTEVSSSYIPTRLKPTEVFTLIRTTEIYWESVCFRAPSKSKT